MEDVDSSIFSAAVWVLFVFCPATAAALRYVTAPYGRHGRAGWGFFLSPALGWFLMESPGIWVTLLLLPYGRHRRHPISVVVISAYLLHYFNRSVVYPLRLLKNGGKGKKENLPVSVAAMAFGFNVLNAYVQTRSATQYVEYEGLGWRAWARVAAGLGLFGWGMWVNVAADAALLRLKREAGGGYRVPKGGWFELVACPNYMGEAAEWLGWAVAAGSPAAFGFFLGTCANLFPRALDHRRWYVEKFGPSFPPSRRAVIPFIL
ncbi:3-oxo-5-alpha-steroid 4-dehydrogenase family protein [Wolffia australiana]